MNVATEYLFGKGKVMLCERESNGSVSKGLYVGNCPELKISGSVEKVDHYESQSGLNTKDRALVKSAALEMSVTLEGISEDNLAVLLWGESNDIAALTTQNYTFPNPVTDDEVHVVPNAFGLTSTSLKDSAGTPVVIPTSKYTLDADFGTIRFDDVATYVQPLKLFYNSAAGKAVPFFTTQRPYRFLRFEGINIGNPGMANQKYLVELYNVGFDPVSDFGLITDDFNKFELKGDLQLDDTRSSNSLLGGYGRIVKF
jgi:hypothetical protein